jgi:hypothetical protein
MDRKERHEATIRCITKMEPNMEVVATADAGDLEEEGT